MAERIDQPGEAFWRFSLALYARPGVAAALIALQDRAGRDVNLILFAMWLGACHGRVLDAQEMTAAEAAIAGLRSVTVLPLRQMRRKLKEAAEPDIQALRRRVAGLEIESERRVQYRLAAWHAALPAASRSDPTAAADANLTLYLGDATRWPEAATLRTALAALARR